MHNKYLKRTKGSSKHIKRTMRNGLAVAILVLSLTGCSNIGGTNGGKNQENNTIKVENYNGERVQGSNTQSENNSNISNEENSFTGNISVGNNSKVIVDKEFSNRDLDLTYEEDASTSIVFNNKEVTVEGSGKQGVQIDNSILTIRKEGTYILSGEWAQGQVLIDTSDSEKVQLVLNGLSITNSNSAPIYVKNSDKVFITLAPTSINTLVDGSDYVQVDDNTVDGVIFSKSDLTLNGEGELFIEGHYKHGIVSKDELIITSGTYHLDVVKDGLNSKEGVKIKDGIFTIHSQEGNGIQSKNGEDETQGYVYIKGGDINIAKGVEGIEGTAIVIEGGKININVSDDGLNASVGTSSSEEENTRGRGGFGGGGGFSVNENIYIQISGGEITIVANGDGIDSNGNIYVTGGTVYVNGPERSGDGALDYDGEAIISGGMVLAVGSSGMSQGFSDSSSQYFIHQSLNSSKNKGSKIVLQDKEGTIILEYTSISKFQSVVISTQELVKGNTYQLIVGDESVEIELNEIGSGNAGRGGFGGMGGFGGNRGGRQ